MTRSRSRFGVPWRTSRPKDAVAVDQLDDLRDAVIGDGLMLLPGEGRLMSLYAVAGGRARALVSCADVLSVWKVLDALDVAVERAGRHEADDLAVEEAA